MDEVDCDVLVVGGGSAGCALAARLSEDPGRQVVLVEAGGETGPATMKVPPAWPSLIGSSVDWGFHTTPQAAAGGAAIPYPRGRVLGGSSSINAMVHLRGQREDYDGWERAGARGWGHEQLLPYFKRTEHAPGRDPAHRGVGGPMQVAPGLVRHPVASAGMAAIEELGLPISDDLNAGDQEGGAWLEFNAPGGSRQSSYDGYLRPCLGRPNLRVRSESLVTSLRIERGRCAGADLVSDGGPETVRAAQTVVCAGAIGTPALMMLSGIGPASALERLGITVHLDAPEVGQNLQDHPLIGIVYGCASELPDPTNIHADAGAVLRSRPGLDRPDLQMLFCDVPFHSPALAGPAVGYTLLCSVLRPASRGTVTLGSADPTAPPVIDPGYFTDERDLRTMTAGLALARRVGATQAFAPLLGEEVLPGAGAADEAALARYVLDATSTYYHPAGTCRLGGDDRAVVDVELRVNGVDDLRIADASVMPTLVSANTNATVLAIAERAATWLGAPEPAGVHAGTPG